jgi:hypothetical protein
VSARNLTRVVEITYTSATPAGRAGANSAADGLLTARQHLVIQPVQDYLNEVAKRTETPLDAEVVNPDDRFGRRSSGWRTGVTGLWRPGSSCRTPARSCSARPPRQVRSEAPWRFRLTSGAALGALVAVLLGIGVQRPEPGG